MGKANVPRVWWIPVYEALYEHEKLLRLKRELKVQRTHAVGMMVSAYLWLANRITEENMDGDDAVLTMGDADAVLDERVEHEGFFDAMCKVGWFTWDPEHKRLRVVRYFEKNGAQALKRARQQSRKVHLRRRREDPSGEEPGVIALDASTLAQGGRRANAGWTEGGRKADAGRTQGGPTADQQKQQQEQHKTIQTASSDTSVSPEAAKLAAWLVENLGITRKIAVELVGEYPGPVLLTAGNMALIAKQQGWEGNLAGYVINRLKDGSAAAAVRSKQVGDDEIAAREWARRFLADDAAAQQAVFDGAVQRRPPLERAGKEAVLSVLPNEAMLALAALLAERVERGEMNGRDVAPAFSAYVTRIGGGA